MWTREQHLYLTFKNPTSHCGLFKSDSWTHVAENPTCLRANFRLPSTDTGDVSTSVEQSLVHLSSSSSSLADLNPLHFRSHPASFCRSFLWLPFSFYYWHLYRSSKSISASVYLFPKATNHTVGYLQWDESKFLFWGWPWRMWVLPLAGDCGCLVWA